MSIQPIPPNLSPEDRAKIRFFRCHKVVQAALISGIGGTDHERFLQLETPDGVVTMPAEDWFFDRHNPKPGDFLVIYEDGYHSVSPAQAFNEGYHPEPTKGQKMLARWQQELDMSSIKFGREFLLAMIYGINPDTMDGAFTFTFGDGTRGDFKVTITPKE